LVSGRLAHALPLLAALLVTLPSLGLGFFSDDYAFLASLEGAAQWAPPWWDLYDFIHGDAPTNARRLAEGALPWWSADGLRLHLVRPLSSALFAANHALFGRWALGYHLVSLGLWMALVALVNRLFHRLLSSRIALLASTIFVLAGAHAMIVAWLSCGHLLLAGVFGVGALLAFDKALDEDRTSLHLASGGLLALALAGSEAALGVLPFLVALALRSSSTPGLAVSQRASRSWALPLLAPASIAALYLVFYKLAGGGASNGGTYVDPLSSPARFLALGVVRLPMLVASALVGVPVEISTPLGNAPLVVLGLVATAGVLGLTRLVWPDVAVDDRRTLRAFGPAAVVALCVGLGGIPGSRQLLLPNLFFAPLFATLLIHGARARLLAGGDERFLRRVARRVGWGVVAFLHVPLALLVGTIGVASMKTMSATVKRVATSPVLSASSRTFAVGTSDPLLGMYTPFVHWAETGKQLACWSMLAMTKADIDVKRIADDALELAIVDGEMLRSPFETLAWDPAVPMVAGHERTQCGAVFRVLAVRDGRPYRVRVTFDKSLDDDTITVLRWVDGELRPMKLSVGAEQRLRWAPGPMGFL
jgi:hypothetical protein